MKILVVDDHALFRKALIRLINTFKQSAQFQEACDGLDAINILKNNDVDLVLLDIQMPRASGIDVLKWIRKNQFRTKVIVLTQFDDQSLIIFMLQLGANGFLLKNAEPEELAAALELIESENHYFNKHVLSAIDHNLNRDSTLVNLDISPREFQVLLHIKDGKSNKEVAHHLGLTQRTIESYRKSLIKKTKCKNSVELVDLAHRTGIIPPPL